MCVSIRSVKGGFPPFGCLEVLMLDDNKLSSGVFHRLRNLRRSAVNLTVFLLQENRAVHRDVTLFVLFSGEEKQHFLKIIIAFLSN